MCDSSWVEMEGEGAMRITLPEELVGKILAMVPFPFVFKARALSKSWLARFSSIRSLDDEEKKGLASSFQELVGEWSTAKWKTFCPIFVRKEDFIGYDRASQHWQRMPSLSFLPENLFSIMSDWWRLEGALLLISDEPDIGNEIRGWENDLVGDGTVEMAKWLDVHVQNTLTGRCPGYKFYVANILTRSWRKLPPRPFLEGRTHKGEKWLIHMSLQMYRVVVFHDDFYVRTHFAEVYDAKLDTWSSTQKLKVSPVATPEDIVDAGLTNWAHLNGILYRVVGSCEMATGLLAFNVKEGNFEVLEIVPMDISKQCGHLELAVCNSNLMMLIYDGYDGHTSVEGVTVRKIDLQSRRWLEVTRGPPAALNFGNFAKKPATAGNCIFFVGAEFDSGILVYNMHEGRWSSFPIPASVRQSDNPYRLGINYTYCKCSYTALLARYQWEPSSFQPGLNPFVGV